MQYMSLMNIQNCHKQQKRIIFTFNILVPVPQYLWYRGSEYTVSHKKHTKIVLVISSTKVDKFYKIWPRYPE